jgi:hypothetical protein
MALIFEKINEDVEIFYDFFNAHVEQLEHYESFFKNMIHRDCIFAQARDLQENIKQEYIPLALKYCNDYKFLKKNINVKNILTRLRELSNVDSKFFLHELRELINDVVYVIERMN